MEPKPFSRRFMFVETGKKFIESFSETRNQKSVYRNVTNVVLFQKHFRDLIILIGFRDVNDFVNLGICKHEFKFTRRGYCRFTSSTEWNNTFTPQDRLQISILHLNIELWPAVQCEHRYCIESTIEWTIHSHCRTGSNSICCSKYWNVVSKCKHNVVYRVNCWVKQCIHIVGQTTVQNVDTTRRSRFTKCASTRSRRIQQVAKARSTVGTS